MKQDYITTHIRIPRSWHRAFKRRAMEDEKSLGKFIRELLWRQWQQEQRFRNDNGATKQQASILDLLNMAKPRGGAVHTGENFQTRKKKFLPKTVHTLKELAQYAQPFGADISSKIDDILYGEDFN